ncbi:unnamed protein product (macronuclear) [Paramecium tetraurelia]|uniref:Beta/gamma crystallin 'Greek key' domain-containing protein n=1 Tax=Paramecium tetraurelia TaxID=5888 RepID=A0E592_PARTE|nr:uncharacterized protein GSPATT00023636001 [Paramecium tetraurelia]CAK90459.1 unnamed protein product [Paramecium tetraurelia]|eukprot:XP_001457856.1 hypothetical protein (macronuclear) [Paramecium tetraurelia strain d4-2]
MPIKALIFRIILIPAIVLAQSNMELSEIETNPIPTMVNFDSNQRNTDQVLSQQGYFDFDGHFISSNTDITQNNEINNSNEDPNNFILDHLSNNTPNSELGQFSNDENSLQGANDIPSLDMIDTQSTQSITQQDINQNSETENTVQNSDCIVIYSQCHFKGESLHLCESQRNIDNFDHDIKSIQIPKGYSVRLYNQEDFSGEKIILKESQECINQPLALTQLYEKKSHKFLVLAQNFNLRAS